jgi:hypothetical protein
MKNDGLMRGLIKACAGRELKAHHKRAEFITRGERRLPFLCFLHTLNRSGAKNSINQFLHLSADGNFIYVCRRRVGTSSSAEEIKSSLSTPEIEGGKFSSLLWRRAPA